MDTPRKLRRYTSLPVLLDMLTNKKITLLDPSTWEDRNDSFFVEKYKELKDLKSVLALCFTTKGDTFHHWKVFANEVGGVCITFDASKFLEQMGSYQGIRVGHVDYRLMRDLKNNPPDATDLPFIKRKQYIDEGEFRVVFESKRKKYNIRQFDFDVQSIERITLSPWLPQPVAKTVKSIIWNMHDCEDIELLKTGVIEHAAWKNIANNLA